MSQAVSNDRQSNHPFLVGIGASAGGIRALQQFFEKVQPGSGIAYAVILHLSPDYDSKLAEVLQTVSALPVTQVKENVFVKADHIYVISPNHHLTMVDGQINTTANTQLEERRAPVDIFFRSLAEHYESRSMAVVLSGTGANGSMGIKRVKELGGAVFAQDPREAEFDEMPRHTLATGLVDEVLPVGEMPGRIVAYFSKLNTVYIPADTEKRDREQQDALKEIFLQIRLRTGHDFSNYKRPTLLRRIERRITVHNLPDIIAYLAFIRDTPEEVSLLLKDLLISVTNFFRDKESFEFLAREVIPSLIKSRRSEDQVRVWVPGCATGEEAYSLAILLAEQTQHLVDAPKIQVFATDIDEAAIGRAREGYYTLNDAADVSQERLNRFFNKDGEGYRIRREIRETVLFANHNFLKDPPFSHLDLISCRNVLIYLNRIAQERVAQTFHFALNPSGWLFLGSSESMDSAADLYSVYNREHHLFQSRTIPARAYPVPESVPVSRPEIAGRRGSSPESAHRIKERLTFGDLHQQLLEEYAPPSLVVNEEHEIVHLSEKAGQYLTVSGGEPSMNLLHLIHPELRLEVRSALYQAARRKIPVEVGPLQVNLANRSDFVNIVVRPAMRDTDTTKGFFLVVFKKAEGSQEPEKVIPSSEPVARHLEDELVRLKAQLKYSNEQHEFHAEELKASNEELQAMNEELGSSSEELETSKEELQSINEELRTVNQELKIKIEETTVSSNNLQNLINSVDIGTVFLDRSFRIVLFTPAAARLFNLIPSDDGRLLSDITSKLEYPGIIEDARAVLEKLQPIEREVRTVDNRIFLARALPYRTADDHISGVVITFFDISARKSAEERLRDSEERFRSIVTRTAAGITETDPEGALVFVNERFATMTGYTETELIGKKSMSQLVFREDAATYQHLLTRCLADEHPFSCEYRLARKDGSLLWVSSSVSVSRDNVRGTVSVIFVTLEVSEKPEVMKALRLSEERLRIALVSSETGAWDWNIETDTIVWNEQYFKLLGLEWQDKPVTADFFLGFVHEEDRRRFSESVRNAVGTRVLQIEFRVRRADGRIRWMSSYGRILKGEQGLEDRMLGVMVDITHQKELERQKDEFIAIASHELKTPVTSIKSYVELLRETLVEPGDTEHAGLAGKLDRQVDRLIVLVNDLLDTSKLSEGRVKLNVSSFDLNSLVENILQDLRRITINQLDFVPGKLPEIKADRERIGQVLTNLLSNAVKYSPEDGRVIVSTDMENEEVLVRVRDSGIGMDDETQARVFERFFRKDDERIRSLPGLGLGLYVAAEIIKLHNGAIGIESSGQDGSVFFFRIPVSHE